MPTLVPGWILVPRWRTMIVPERIVWPSPHFTPSILGLLSRPLREEPTPFLCAISFSLRSNMQKSDYRLISYSQPGEVLPVACFAAIALFGFVLEDYQLGASVLGNDGSEHFRAFEQGAPTCTPSSPPPTISTSPSSTWAPRAPSSLSTTMVSPGVTLYWWPPVLIIAYKVFPPPIVSVTASNYTTSTVGL